MKKQILLYLMVLLIFFTLCGVTTAHELPPALEIEGVTFSEVLYAGQTRTLSIKIKNTGLGDAHDVTVELSSNLQGLSFPTSTKVPTIPKGGTQTVKISVSGKKELSDENKARISIRLIDTGHNQEFPFDKPWTRTFKTRELELVLDQVKFNNVSRPDKPIQRNDVINLKFRVYNKSGVKAEKVAVKVENNQKGVKWSGAKIGEPLGDPNDLPQERPALATLNPKAYKVINYVYHLDRDFKAREVQFTLSGTVGAEKDQWVKEKYQTSVIIPFNWFRIFGWIAVGVVIIVVVIIGVAIKTKRNIATFKGHTDWVWSVTYSPDGKTLASGGRDKTVKLWDVNAKRNIATFKGHTYSVYSVTYSPDGKTLASGGRDKTVKLWDVNTQRNIATFKGHTNSVFFVTYSPDGKTLASGAADKTVKLWDVNTQRNIATFEGHTDWVYSVTYSPDGKTLASGGRDKTVKLWDVNTQRNIATFEGHTNWVWSVPYSPDGKTLASGSGDKTVKLWDVNTRRNIATFKHSSAVTSVTYSPDGKTLASGAADKTVKLWDVDPQRNIATFKGHTDIVRSVAYSPDGKTLASGSDDKTVKLWDVNAKRNIATY